MHELSLRMRYLEWRGRIVVLLDLVRCLAVLRRDEDVLNELHRVGHRPHRTGTGLVARRMSGRYQQLMVWLALVRRFHLLEVGWRGAMIV